MHVTGFVITGIIIIIMEVSAGLAYRKFLQYTELLIGRVALTSFNRRTYHVVRIGAYSLNNLGLG